ncbi:MAG: ribonuclease P protein component 1 [Thermoprotei archaeon]|nr:ribonuclease P protein component 1 [Thermoprotei archaeon]
MAKLTPSNIINHELIGLKVKVTSSKNKTLVGIKGVVIDETRNTLVVLDRGKPKIIPKNVADFEFTLPDGNVVLVKGEILIGSPEDRVKRLIRRRW